MINESFENAQLGKPNVRDTDKQKGFTLVELMVVVAIIGILAAIGLPQMTKFIRNASTAEPISQMGHIEKAIRGFVDSRPNVDAATLETDITGKIVQASCSASCLSSIIPEVEVASDHEWIYTVAVDVDTDRVPWVCIRAHQGTATADAVFFSTRQSTNSAWNNHAFTQPFVVTGTAFVAGGTCSAATPTATAASNDA